MTKQDFYFSDGTKLETTLERALELCQLSGRRLVTKDEFYNAIVRKRIPDGWKAGFQPALGIECRHKDEYLAEIKKRGLIEVGYDSGSSTKYNQAKPTDYYTEDVLKEIKELVPSVSHDTLQTAENKKNPDMPKESNL